ncbi:AEC family transporter [Niallia sp. XMNu-256]|uniref:AEC family transporter n=1 Tax=Niallia sp. XMNu-256 TaxID=3082444 RepID=UPI0030D138CC
MIQSLFSTLLGVIVPLALPVVAGALLSRYKQLEIKPLLTIVLYYLTPALIFDTLMNAEVSSQDVYLTLGFSISNLILLWAAANILGRLMKLPANDIAGLTLISAFTNSVNYGIPLILLAFGQLGLDKASVYVVLQMVIVNTIGVYFAARSHFSIKGAIKSVFSLPAIYAAMIALILRSLDTSLPIGIVSGISMIADSYSPIVLAILGIQMMNVKTDQLDRGSQKAFWTGMGMRLLIAPLVALATLSLLNINGILHSVLFVLACMPVAVNAGILAQKFDASVKVVTKCILWTTLISFFLLPFIIVLVQ